MGLIHWFLQVWWHFHTYIVRWWHGQLFWLHLWSAFEVFQENPLTFDSLDCRQISGSYVSLSPSIGVLRTSFGKLPEFLPDSRMLGCQCVQRISLHERVEVVDSVIFSQLIMNFDVRLEKVLKQRKLLRSPIKCWHRFGEQFWQIGILLILLWKFAEFLLFANCWRPKKIWSASTVARVSSLRKCGWPVEQLFFCFPEDVLGKQYVTSSWTPVTMSWLSSEPEFRVVRLWKTPASAWESLWESSTFVPWFVPYAFRDASGGVPEWLSFNGFMKKSSRRDNAPNMRFSVLLNSWDNFFVTFPSFLQKRELYSLLEIWEHSVLKRGMNPESLRLHHSTAARHN